MPLLAALVMPSASALEDHHKASLNRPKPVVMDAEDVTIEMSLPQGFTPPSIEIKTGTTVTWHNAETIDYPVVSGYHQVVADGGEFESPKVAPGARWSYTFLEPGTFNYHCGVHATMTGQIVVTGQPVKDEPKDVRVEIVEPDPNDQQSWGYKPKDVTVEVGATVTWVNNGAQTHTVTDGDGAFDSGDLAPGDKFTFTFKKAGVFHYHCEPHPWMEGTVSVHEPGKAPPKDTHEDSGDGSSSAPPPSSPSNPSSSGSGPTTYDVNIVEGGSTDDWGYDPASLSIATGDTVVWTNTGSTDHTVTAEDGSFDSGSIPPGGTWEYTFSETGDFQYHCTPHPFMMGTISVSDSPAGGGGAVGTSGSASGPTVPGSPTTSDQADEPVAAGEEAAAGIDGAPTASLSGKEASLGAIASLLVASLAFLVGQWWGFNVRRVRTSGGAA
jgi:plastocyanin